MQRVPLGNREPVEQGPPILFDYGRFDIPANIDLEIYFAAHMTEADLPAKKELKQIFRNSDIVVIEAEGADQTEEVLLNRLSQGDPQAGQAVNAWIDIAKKRGIQAGWKEVFYDALEGSGIAVASPDLLIGHPLTPRRHETSLQIDSISLHSDFDFAVNSAAELWARRLKLMSRRDQYILEHLAPSIDHTVAKSSELTEKRAKQPLRAVMFYGSDHLSLFDALTQKAVMSEPVGFSVVPNHERDGRPVSQEVYGNYLRGIDPNLYDIARLTTTLAFSALYHKMMDQVGLQGPWRDTELRIKEELAGSDYEELRAKRDEALVAIEAIKRQ